MEDERQPSFNSPPIFEGTNINCGDVANHDVEKVAWENGENRDDELSVYEAAHEHEHGEKKHSIESIQNFNESERPSLDDGGTGIKGKGNTKNGYPTDGGLSNGAQNEEVMQEEIGLCIKNNENGLLSGESGGTKKERKKPKARK